MKKNKKLGDLMVKEDLDFIEPILLARPIKEVFPNYMLIGPLSGDRIESLSELLQVNVDSLEKLEFIDKLVEILKEEVEEIKTNYKRILEFKIPSHLEELYIRDIYPRVFGIELIETQYFKDNPLKGYKNLPLNNVYNMAHRNSIYKLFSKLSLILDKEYILTELSKIKEDKLDKELERTLSNYLYFSSYPKDSLSLNKLEELLDCKSGFVIEKIKEGSIQALEYNKNKDCIVFT